MSDEKRFGRYEVRETIGRGAMGVVYLAEDPVIGRKVAIKVVEGLESLEPDELEQLQTRFEREFQSAGRLSHPNIVSVHDVGQEDGNAFIAMEYVQGESLHSILAQNRAFSFKEVADLTAQLCSGLDYAHEFGIVHRDIKPANILITRDGRPKITDFGVAKVATTTLTRTGTVVGTPAYMSPEQVTGHPVDGAADQFSLAVMVYQMLTGERPFTGENPTTIMYKIVHEEPVPPSVLNAMVPGPVDRALIRALAKNPEARYPTCMELADTLRASLGAAPTDATVVMSTSQAEATVVDPPLTRPKRAPVRKEPRRRVAGLVLVGFAALAVVAGGVAYDTGLLDEILAMDAGVTTEPAPVPEELVTHTLSIEAPGGWSVWINGEDSGVRTTSPEPTAVELSRFPHDEIMLELRFEDTTFATTTFVMADAPASWAPHGLGVAAVAPGEAEPGPVELPAEPVLTTFAIVSTPPGATVTFDGDVLERVTPVDVAIDLSDGTEHSVGLQLEGYDAEGIKFLAQDLDEQQLAARELNFPLTSSIPPGFVSIDNSGYPVVVVVKPIGGGDVEKFAASNSHRIGLPPGEYIVELSAPSVYWNPGDQRRITVESKQVEPIVVPRAVSVQVGANPGNCVVSINDVEVGPPPFRRQVVAGVNSFEFDWTGIDLGARILQVTVDTDNQQIFGIPER